MSTDQKAIVDYLKTWPHLFISGREIARKVGGKKRCAEDRYWAQPILVEMVREGLLETDAMNGYRVKVEDRKKKNKALNRHVSPQILRILKSSGKKFDGLVIDEDLADTLEPDASKPFGGGTS
jgi:hypothetical protein